MKNVLLIICAGVLFSACKKDKFTTEPKISFENISPNYFSSEFNTSLYKESAPKLILKVTDAEGDFGSTDITDSSMIYIKNLLSNKLDSTEFPDLTRAPKKDFSAEVSINLFDFLVCVDPGPARPRIDTTYFEVYIMDAKKHKSNVITTPKPVYYECK
ncbi:MAG: hypothetical protein QM687_13445 [Ferruginibacter sp.]